MPAPKFSTTSNPANEPSPETLRARLSDPGPIRGQNPLYLQLNHKRSKNRLHLREVAGEIAHKLHVLFPRMPPPMMFLLFGSWPVDEEGSPLFDHPRLKLSPRLVVSQSVEDEVIVNRPAALKFAFPEARDAGESLRGGQPAGNLGKGLHDLGMFEERHIAAGKRQGHRVGDGGKLHGGKRPLETTPGLARKLGDEPSRCLIGAARIEMDDFLVRIQVGNAGKSALAPSGQTFKGLLRIRRS